MASSYSSEVFIPTTLEVRMSMTEQQQHILVEQHLPLVRQIAAKVCARLPKHVDIGDIEGDGVVGLVDAARKFQPSKKVPFGAYARLRINGAIVDGLRRLDWGVRHTRRMSRKIDDVYASLVCRLRRFPDDSELAEEMGMSLPHYHKLRCELDNLLTGSLNNENGEIIDVQDCISEDPFTHCVKAADRSRISDAVSCLPEIMQSVLTLHYHDDMPLREIAEILCISPTRTSQYHNKALNCLQIMLTTGQRMTEDEIGHISFYASAREVAPDHAPLETVEVAEQTAA